MPEVEIGDLKNCSRLCNVSDWREGRSKERTVTEIVSFASVVGEVIHCVDQGN